MTEVNLEKRLRIGTIRIGLRRAHERLTNDINIGENDTAFSAKVFHVNASICELLFWVLANDEWHLRNNWENYNLQKELNVDGANKISGLRHAYNASKHNMNFIHLFTFEGTKSFIEGLGLKIADPTTSVIWMDCPDDEERENQVKKYREYLKGEKVMPTFEQAITFLNSVNHDVFFTKN